MTLRVPAGHYTLTSFITRSSQSALLAQPDVNVDGPLTINLDARLGQPIEVTVPRADAWQYYAVVAAYTRRPHGSAGTALVGDSFADIYTAGVGPDQRDDGFVSVVSGQWAKAGAGGSFRNSPYTYALSFPEPGRMVTGYRRTVADGQLARVRADFTHGRPGTTGAKRIRSTLTAWDAGNFGPY